MTDKGEWGIKNFRKYNIKVMEICFKKFDFVKINIISVICHCVYTVNFNNYDT